MAAAPGATSRTGHRGRSRRGRGDDDREPGARTSRTTHSSPDRGPRPGHPRAAAPRVSGEARQGDPRAAAVSAHLEDVARLRRERGEAGHAWSTSTPRSTPGTCSPSSGGTSGSPITTSSTHTRHARTSPSIPTTRTGSRSWTPRESATVTCGPPMAPLPSPARMPRRPPICPSATSRSPFDFGSRAGARPSSGRRTFFATMCGKESRSRFSCVSASFRTPTSRRRRSSRTTRGRDPGRLPPTHRPRRPWTPASTRRGSAWVTSAWRSRVPRKRVSSPGNGTRPRVSLASS